MLDEISEQGRKASAFKSEEQTAFQKQVGQTRQRAAAVPAAQAQPPARRRGRFRAAAGGVPEELRPGPGGCAGQRERARSSTRKPLRRMAGPLQQFQIDGPVWLSAYRAAGGSGARRREEWQNMGASLLDSVRAGALHPAVTILRRHGYGLPPAKARRLSTGRWPNTRPGSRPSSRKQLKKAGRSSITTA